MQNFPGIFIPGTRLIAQPERNQAKPNLIYHIQGVQLFKNVHLTSAISTLDFFLDVLALLGNIRIYSKIFL